jgi:hypothetical protein
MSKQTNWHAFEKKKKSHTPGPPHPTPPHATHSLTSKSDPKDPGFQIVIKKAVIPQIPQVNNPFYPCKSSSPIGSLTIVVHV